MRFRKKRVMACHRRALSILQGVSVSGVQCIHSQYGPVVSIYDRIFIYTSIA